MENSFDNWIENAKASGHCTKIAVVAAHDEHTLEAVLAAEKSGLIVPVLIGDMPKIEAILSGFDKDPQNYEIVDIPEKEAAARYASSLALQGDRKSVV